MTGALYEPLQTCEGRFLAQKALFLLALASAKRIGELHALLYRVSRTRGWGEVSFSFVAGFVAKTQDPSSLAPRFEGFSVPALPNVRNNRNGRLLCPVRAVRCCLDRTAAHRPCCELLFVTAWCSKKEISKTTVSFWLRKTISLAYQLSGTEQKALFLLALASAKWIGELHALLYRVSRTRGWGEVSFSFVAGFVAKTQDPSSLAPRFEGFSVPALPNVRNNRNGRLLCPVRAVRCCLDRTAAHRPCCELLFVTAWCSKKEISKTTVSFWLRKTISLAYQLSGTEQPVPAPRAQETRGVAPSLLFKKSFTVDQVLKAGTWRKHTTFTRHYLRDIAHQSLDTFHLGPVVAAQVLF